MLPDLKWEAFALIRRPGVRTFLEVSEIVLNVMFLDIRKWQSRSNPLCFCFSFEWKDRWDIVKGRYEKEEDRPRIPLWKAFVPA